MICDTTNLCNINAVIFKLSAPLYTKSFSSLVCKPCTEAYSTNVYVQVPPSSQLIKTVTLKNDIKSTGILGFTLSTVPDVNFPTVTSMTVSPGTYLSMEFKDANATDDTTNKTIVYNPTFITEYIIADIVKTLPSTLYKLNKIIIGKKEESFDGNISNENLEHFIQFDTSNGYGNYTLYIALVICLLVLIYYLFI